MQRRISVILSEKEWKALDPMNRSGHARIIIREHVEKKELANKPSVDAPRGFYTFNPRYEFAA